MPIPLSTAQSLVQLAAALNVAYFTFMSVSSPFFLRFDSKFSLLKGLCDQANPSAVGLNEARACQDDYDTFVTDINKRYYGKETKFMYISFGAFLLLAILLLLTTMLPNYDLGYLWTLFCLTVFALGYIPIVVIILIETTYRRRFNTILTAAENSIVLLQNENRA